MRSVFSASCRKRQCCMWLATTVYWTGTRLVSVENRREVQQRNPLAKELKQIVRSVKGASLLYMGMLMVMTDPWDRNVFNSPHWCFPQPQKLAEDGGCQCILSDVKHQLCCWYVLTNKLLRFLDSSISSATHIRRAEFKTYSALETFSEAHIVCSRVINICVECLQICYFCALV